MTWSLSSSSLILALLFSPASGSRYTLSENALKRIAVTNLHSLLLCRIKHRPGFVGIGAFETEDLSAKQAEVLEISAELLPVVLENCVIRNYWLLCGDCKETPNSSTCVWRSFCRASAKTAITRYIRYSGSCFATTQDLIDRVSQFRKLSKVG